MKQRVLVICPGRGSYTERELGSLARALAESRGPAEHTALNQAIDAFDEERIARSELGIRAMDASERFSARLLKGENAAPLIFACTAADFLRLDREKVEIVAVTGNSMGWYSALHCGGVFGPAEALRLITTMGGSQRDGITGGQLIYPLVDPKTWLPDPAAATALSETLERARAAGHAAYPSIRLGGMAVLAGDEDGVRFLLEELPTVKFGGRDYPFRLMFHAAFHTPLLADVSAMGKSELVDLPWDSGTVPLIDGRGHQHRPLTTDPGDLFDYTLGHQVTELYDFTTAVRVGLREYAPDRVVLLGPGEGLGGAIAQVLIAERWQGITNRQEFIARQNEDPFLISMVREEQAGLVC